MLVLGVGKQRVLESYCLMGTELQFYKMKKSPGDQWYNDVSVFNTTELYTETQ